MVLEVFGFDYVILASNMTQFSVVFLSPSKNMEESHCIRHDRFILFTLYSIVISSNTISSTVVVVVRVVIVVVEVIVVLVLISKNGTVPVWCKVRNKKVILIKITPTYFARLPCS